MQTMQNNETEILWPNGGGGTPGNPSDVQILALSWASLILAPFHKADFCSKKGVIFRDGGWLGGAAALPLIPRNAFTAWPITAELSANCKHTAKGRQEQAQPPDESAAGDKPQR